MSNKAQNSLKPTSHPEVRIMVHLVKIAEAYDADATRFLKKYGLSILQYNVLRIVRGMGDDGIPSQEIKNRMVHRVMDVTRLVDRLETNGLVTRLRPKSDRRQVLVRLSNKGKKLMEEMDEPFVKLLRSQIPNLSEAELSRLESLLHKVRSAVETSSKETSSA